MFPLLADSGPRQLLYVSITRRSRSWTITQRFHYSAIPVLDNYSTFPLLGVSKSYYNIFFTLRFHYSTFQLLDVSLQTWSIRFHVSKGKTSCRPIGLNCRYLSLLVKKDERLKNVCSLTFAKNNIEKNIIERKRMQKNAFFSKIIKNVLNVCYIYGYNEVAVDIKYENISHIVVNVYENVLQVFHGNPPQTITVRYAPSQSPHSLLKNRKNLTLSLTS